MAGGGGDGAGAGAAGERSTYLRRAVEDPALIADRDAMIRCFLEDVRRLAPAAAERLPPAPRRPREPLKKATAGLLEQSAADQKPSSAIRLVTWNVNILMGADGRTTVDPSAVAAVIEPLDADVVVLQEAPEPGLEKKWSESLFAEPVARVQVLAESLAAMGYTLLRSCADNGTLLATRLPVASTEDGPVLDAAPVCSVNGGSLWSETRAARFAELLLPGLGGGAEEAEAEEASPARLALYATHLHHKDIEKSDKGEDRPGVRQREAARLLQHWRERVDSAQAAGPLATVLLADFNQPRSRDVEDSREWHVVVTGLAHPAVAQPAADGVSELLESEGFVCAFDERGAARNFGGAGAAPFTHWTGTTIDFAYVHTPAHAQTEVLGTYVVYTPLSDHLPVVTDLCVRRRAAQERCH